MHVLASYTTGGADCDSMHHSQLCLSLAEPTSASRPRAQSLEIGSEAGFESQRAIYACTDRPTNQGYALFDISYACVHVIDRWFEASLLGSDI
jgi:hypothetical protein